MENIINDILLKYTIVKNGSLEHESLEPVSKDEILKYLNRKCIYTNMSNGLVKKCNNKVLKCNDYCKTHLKFKLIHNRSLTEE